MSDLDGASPSAGRQVRSDAVRSRAAILDAAVRLLEHGPFAGLGDVAREAGLTRQTIYAHFPSRQDLLAAVIDRLVGDYEATIGDAHLDEGSATDAVGRLFAVGRVLSDRGGAALENVARMTSAEESMAQHDPIMETLVSLVRRGQEAGEFDADVPASWLAAATIALGHAAAAEVAAGRLAAGAADRLVVDSVLRLYGAR